VTQFREGTRAVIFDLDGVIVDSEPLHQEAFRLLMGELGIEESAIGDWNRFVGTADRPVLLQLIEGRSVAQSADALLERKGALFLELLRQREPIFPEIPALVEDLARRYVMAVASGSLRTAIAGVLGMRGLRQHFQHAISVQDVARGKPAPDLFLRAAELLGVTPSDCVVIEDSAPGVAAARAAGMRVIAITNTTEAGRLAGADAVVGSFGEIRGLLLGDLEEIR
jgi:HAD superfamily hydrolase (TIGR01509 family)